MKKKLLIGFAFTLIAGAIAFPHAKKALADIYGSGLIGLYSLDSNDVAGTTVTDQSGTGNTGTTHGSPTAVVGKMGQALNLASASSQYVGLGTMGSFGTQMYTAYSFSTWAKTTATTLQYLAGVYNNGSTFGMHIETNGAGNVTDAGKLGMYIRDKDAFHGCEKKTTDVTSPAFNDGKWHLLTYTYATSSTMHIYVDGIDQPLSTVTSCDAFLNTFANFGFEMTVGARNVRGTVSGFFNGSMDDVRWYNRTLSPSEVMSLYHQGQAKFSGPF